MIDTIAAEHAILNLLFDEIAHALPEARTLAEVRLLARLVERLLAHHADLEENLAYAALDHALEHNGQVQRLSQDHREMDARLRLAQSTANREAAVRLLLAGLLASRDHFRWEEETIFPLFHQQFAPLHGPTQPADTPIASPALGPHGFANALRTRLRSSGVQATPRSP